MSETSAVAPGSSGKRFWGHPRMLWMLLIVTVGFNFAFYGFRAYLAPYLQTFVFGDLPKNVAIQHADLVFSAFGALLYAAPIVGGWVADNVLGKVRALRLSLWLGVIGLLAMALPTKFGLLVGLAFFVITAGLNIPLTVLIGLNYDKNDPKRDAGYTIYYLAINLGAFFAPFVIADWVASDFGPRTGFLAAAGAQIIVSIVYELGQRRLPSADDAVRLYRKYSMPLVIACCLALTYPVAMLLVHPDVLHYILYALMAALVIYFVVKSAYRGDRVQSHRYIAMLILFVALVAFWSFSLLSASALNFFARDYVGPMWHGSIPVLGDWSYKMFQSADPLLILIFAVPLSILWPWLEKRGFNPVTPRKFGIGVILVAIGYGVLVLFDRYGVSAGERIPWWGLGLRYLCSTTGELTLSPIGYALIGKLAAREDVSFAMGGWFFGTSLAYSISGQIAALTTANPHAGMDGYTQVFFWLFWIGLAIGVAYLIAARWITKLMHGVT